MATYNKPGVYIEERPYANSPIAVASGPSTAAFIGVADRGPTTTVSGAVYGTPTLVTSWSDFLSKFSYGPSVSTWTSSVDPTLKYAVKSFFDNLVGGQAWVTRQVNTDATKASATVYERNGQYIAPTTGGSIPVVTVVKAASSQVISIGFDQNIPIYPRVGSRVTLGGSVPSVNINGNASTPLSSLFNLTDVTATTPSLLNKFIVTTVATTTAAATSNAAPAAADTVNGTSFRLKFAAAHNFLAGQIVTINGLGGAQAGNYNVTNAQILAVPDSTTITVSSTAVNSADTVTGTATVTPIRTFAVAYNTTDTIAATQSTGGFRIKGLAVDSGATGVTAYAPTLKINANEEGTWAGNIWYTITPGLSDGKFDLTVYYTTATNSSDVINGGWSERFSDLTMNAADPLTYAPTKVTSNYVTIVDQTSSAIDWFDLPIETGVWSVSPTDYISGLGTTATSPVFGSGYDSSKFTPTAIQLVSPSLQTLGTFPTTGTVNGNATQTSVATYVSYVQGSSVTVNTGTIPANNYLSLVTIGTNGTTAQRTKVIPGFKYGLSASFTKPANSTAYGGQVPSLKRMGQLLLNWYDSNGTFIGNTSASSVVTGTTATTTTVSIASVTPPYNADSYHATFDYSASIFGDATINVSPAIVSGTSNVAPTVSATSSTQLTLSAVTGLFIGQRVTGTGIVSGAVISAVDTVNNKITLSSSATPITGAVSNPVFNSLAITPATSVANLTASVNANTNITCATAGIVVGMRVSASGGTITTDPTGGLVTAVGTGTIQISVQINVTNTTLNFASFYGNGTTATAVVTAQGGVHCFAVGDVLTISNTTSLDGIITVTATSANTISWATTIQTAPTLGATSTITRGMFPSSETYTVSGLTVTPTITGSDGSIAPSIGTQIDQLANISGPLVFNYPGKTSVSDINTILSRFGDRADTFVVIDSAIQNYGAVGTAATPALVSTVLSNYSTINPAYKNIGAVYYPSIYINDPASTTGKTKLVYSGGAIAAKYVSTDLSRGVFKAPAGLGVQITNAVAVTPISNADFDTLSKASVPVNVIRYVPGANYCVMGARTLSLNPADRYVNTRRTLIYLKKSLGDLAQFAVFEPNTQATWTELTNRLDAFLYDFWRQGGLNGNTSNDAYFIKCDADTNGAQQIQDGELRAQVGVALVRPAEFVIISIGQTDGGISVTTTA